MNKLERKLINNKHRDKMLWCGFVTQTDRQAGIKQTADSYRTKALKRDEQKLMKGEWK
jgi:hypothetical protein